jgi:hypothetical protein
MARLKAQGKIDEFAFVLLAGLVIIIIMLFAWGVPSQAEIPAVSPDSISLAINKGSSKSILLEINVTSKSVTLTSKGTIADWVEFSDNNFESEGLSNVEIKVSVPRGTDERDYFGSIIVESSEGGKVTIPLSVKVTSETETPETREISRTEFIGDFDVTFEEGKEIVKSERNIEVRGGSGGGGKTTLTAYITKNLDMITDSTIIIDVAYSNNEGNLVVKLNNKIIYDQKVLPGEIIIPVDKGLLSSYNIIEISTSAPGWKFWATSIYNLDRFEFNVGYFGAMSKIEPFNVYREELINFKQGRVEFNIKSYEGEGKLTVRINDYIIFDGRRRGYVLLTFNYVDVGLIKGSNIISFDTETGSSYNIENAKIILVHEE